MNDEDYDDYSEPQPAEISGPVAPSRPRAVRAMRVAVAFPRRQQIPVFHHVFATPFRTGPPA